MFRLQKVRLAFLLLFTHYLCVNAQNPMLQPSDPTNQYQQSGGVNHSSRMSINEVLDDIHEADRTSTPAPTVKEIKKIPDEAGLLRCEDAYKEITEMLEGKKSLNLKRAIFLVENAYSGNLNYNLFCKQIRNAVSVCRYIMKSNGWNPSSPLSVNMAIQKYMSEYTRIYDDSGRLIKTIKPMVYDFDDFMGDSDYTKMFVTKLVQTRSGNCHSLPLFYKTVSLELKTPAYISYAPNHSFIQFKDADNALAIYETTSGYILSEDEMLRTGYIKTEAIKNKVFLDTTTTTENVAECLVDLADGYEAKYGKTDFSEKCATTALKYAPHSARALIVYANLITVYTMREAKRLGNPPIESWHNYSRLSELHRLRQQLYNLQDASGYQQIPAEEYKTWLQSMNDEKERRKKLLQQLKAKG